jgi:low temperature requirement protein LtrA
MGLLSLMYLIAAIIYLGTFFGFKKDGSSSYTYITWYILAGIETILNVVVTSSWKVVSFKGTHLVQRMTLLTLIILGEGIIVICKSITAIVKNEKASTAWSAATIGAVVAAVMIVVSCPSRFECKVC